MKQQSHVVVLKFGSSVLKNEDDLPTAVHEIYRWWRNGAQVVVVVSALGDTTDQLLRRAERVCERPHKSVLPSLLATGETTSSALLTLQLHKVGIPARLLDEVQVNLRTVGGGIDAVPISVDASRLLADARRAVVVLPGFVGRDENNNQTLFGRGGSDLTALFLAQQLKARCVLIKDVDGLYTSDPATTSVRASRFSEVSYETAVRLGGPVVQAKAVRFACANRIRFSIARICANSTTEVGPFTDRLDTSRSFGNPLRIALLGCGTVGGGVFERLAALPGIFTITGVGTRTGVRARTAGVPAALMTDDLEGLVKTPCDVVVELIGGTRRAASLIEQSLRMGRKVVSANKALIARSQEAFEILAEETQSSLHYSAAVGGVLPALETIKRAKENGPLQSFSGVLNGTCNFVLDQLAAGSTFGAAVRAAQERGYAEENPQLDLDGIDAAQKLILLARAAFDVSLPLQSMSRKGIEHMDVETMRQNQERGKTVRLLVECRKSGDRIEASVAPVELPLNHSLAQVNGAENRLLVQPAVGDPIVVSGTGAGRWPTTEAVMADLFDIVRQRSGQELQGLEACVA
ncbi:MAG: homoserine dehydrogenase [Pyrinomonadaceae bacterium]